MKPPIPPPFDAQTREERLAEVVRRETPRLRNWLRRQAPNMEDVEELLQETFCELVVAYRLTTPIRHITGWLYRVARNRLSDLFRKRRTSAATQSEAPEEFLEDGEEQASFDRDALLPDFGASPENAYAWAALILELEAALADLPKAQRDIFIAHEIAGQSFSQIATTTEESIKTLLWRKHAAVSRLRRHLRASYDEIAKS